MSENSKIELLTTKQLAAIADREKRASTPPWKVATEDDWGEDWPITTGQSSIDGQAYHVCTNNVRASQLSGDAKTDAEFISHARQDIPALLRHIQKFSADAAKVLKTLNYAHELIEIIIEKQHQDCRCQFCESLPIEIEKAIAILSEYPTP